jgi:hypothetical protein
MIKVWRGAAAVAAAIVLSAVMSMPPAAAATADSIGNAQIPFIVNRGQVDARVAFYAHTFAGTVFATRGGELVYALPGWALRESFVDGIARPTAGAAATTNISVLTSAVQLPSIATTRSVRFGEVWDGVEVEIHARGDNIEKVFTLEAGRSADDIALRIDGATLSLGRDGSLIATTGKGPVRFAAPYAFQESGSGRREVAVAYRLDGGTYGFVLGDFDPALPVVIDPIIQSTYLGGSGTSFAQEGPREMAIHPVNGNVYVAGVTDSADLPGVVGGAVPASSNVTGFVARFSADLQTLQQATYFGGSSDEWIHALLVTATDVYIAGHSAAPTLPAGVTPGAQPADPNPGLVLNGFIARLPLSLTSVTASTFLGGTSNRLTQILDATLHPNGDLYVCGVTESATLPGTAGGFDDTNLGQERTAFVARVTPTLGAFQQLTYFSQNSARCTAIVADPNVPNDVYIGGEIEFGAAPPNIAGGVLTTGNSGAYLARLNAALTQNPQSTYISGTGAGMDTPRVYGLRQHPSNGDLYVLTTGRSDAPLPANATTNGGQTTCNGVFHCMLVLRVTPNLTSVVAGTFYGNAAGAPIPRAFDHMTIDPTSGDVFVVSDGHTGLPNTTGGFQPAPLSNGTPGFVVRIRGDLGAIIQASYLSGTDVGNTALTSPASVALHPLNGHLYVAGQTSASGFPQTSGGAQPTFGGTFDGFVTRMTPDLLAGAASAGTLQFSQASYSVGEGNVTAQITVTRTSGTDGAVSVSYATSNGTASAGSDYTAASGTLSWATGDGAPKTFDVTIQDDALVEGSEGIGVTLTNTTGGATLGSQATSTLTITDNDAPSVAPGAVQFGAASASINENGGSVTLTLTRTNGADGAISVSVASGGGSAAAGTDYTAVSQTVSWANGDTAAKTVVLAVTDDALDEPNETVVLTLSNATGGATLGVATSATVTIVDDDPTPPGPSAQSVSARGSYGGGAMGWWMLIPALLALLRGSLTWAADDSAGWYIGVRGGVAKSTLEESDIERALAARGHAVDASVDDSHAMGALFGGLRWENGFGVEIGFVDLGEYEITLAAATTDPAALLQDARSVLADAGRAVSTSLTWTWQISERIELTPRLGGYYWESERELRSNTGSVQLDQDGLDLTAGIALGVRVSPVWSLGLAWDVWDAGDRNDIRAWNASLTYRFGSR